MKREEDSSSKFDLKILILNVIKIYLILHIVWLIIYGIALILQQYNFYINNDPYLYPIGSFIMESANYIKLLFPFGNLFGTSNMHYVFISNQYATEAVMKLSSNDYINLLVVPSDIIQILGLLNSIFNLSVTYWVISQLNKKVNLLKVNRLKKLARFMLVYLISASIIFAVLDFAVFNNVNQLLVGSYGYVEPLSIISLFIPFQIIYYIAAYIIAMILIKKYSFLEEENKLTI